MSSKTARTIRAAAKLLTRLVVGLTLVGLVAGFTLYFIPFHFEFVDAHARRAFRTATGLELRFDTLLFYLAQQRIVLRGAEVLDLETGQVLAGARRIEAQSDWRWRDSASIRHIRSLRIEDPDPLQFTASARGLKPSPSLARLLETGARGAGGGEGWRIEALSLRGAAFDLLGDGGGQPLARIDNAILIGSWSGSTSFEFLAHGSIRTGSGGKPATWGGRFSSLPEGPGLSFFTNVTQLAAENQAMIDFPLAVSGNRIRFGGRIRPDGQKSEAVSMDLDLAADNLTLLNKRAFRRVQTRDLRLSAQALYEPSSSTLRLQSADAQALDFRAAGRGWIGLRDPYDYDLRLENIEAPPQALQRLQDFVPDFRAVAAYEGGMLSGSGTVRGSLLRALPDIVDVQATLSGVRLNVPALTLPLRDLTGTLRFDGQTARAERLSGRFGQSQVELGLSLEGESPNSLLERRPRRLRLDWRLDGRSDDLVTLLAHTEASAIEGLVTSGSVDSFGVLTADFGATPTLQAAAKSLQVRGEARLKDFRVDHPSLPAPIENVSGFLDVENKAIQSRDLKGSALGSTVSVTGSVKGSPYFWLHPKADLHISSEVDVGRLAPVVKKRLGLQAEVPPLSGKASLAIDLAGDPRKPNALTYSGDLGLHNLATELHTAGLAGRIQNISGRVLFDAGRLRFEALKFRIGQAAYEFTGELTRADVKGALRLAGPFKTIQAAHPQALNEWTVGGEIDLAADLHLGLSEPERSQALADKRRPPFMAFADGAKSLWGRSLDSLQTASGLFQSLDGRIVAKDAEMTFQTMPARLTKINGTVHLGKEGFSAEGLTMDIGTFPDVGTFPSVAKGEFFFNRDGHRGLDCVITSPKVDMTAWYGPWREAPEQFATKPPPPGRKPFIKQTIRVVLHADEAKRERYTLQNHDAEFLFTNWRGPNNTLDIVGLSGEACQGRAFTKGRITLPHEGKAFWNMEIEVLGVEINDLIETVFGTAPNAYGKLNADFTIGGEQLRSETYQGKGRLEVIRPYFADSSWLSKSESAMGLRALLKSMFPKLEGDFVIQDSYVQSERMTMGNDVVELVGGGKVWFDTRMDVNVHVKPLKAIDDIPLLGNLSEALGMVSGSLLRFHIGGRAGDPLIVPAPLSTDKLLERPSAVGSGDKGGPRRASPTPTPLPLKPTKRISP